MPTHLDQGLDDQGLEDRFPAGTRNCFFSKRPDWFSQHPIQWILRALSTEVRRLGREAHYLPPSSAEIKSECRCTFTPPISPHGMVLKFKDTSMACSFTASVHVQGPLVHFVTHYSNVIVVGLTPKLEDHPLTSLHNCLFSVFSLHVCRAFFFKASCCVKS